MSWHNRAKRFLFELYQEYSRRIQSIHMDNETTSKQNSLTLYFVIAFLIPIIASTFITLRDGLSPTLAVTDISALTLVVIMTMVHAPTIAALVASFRDQGFKGIKELFRQLKFWKFTPGWYAKALFIFPVTMVGTLLILSFFSLNYAPVLNLTVLTFGTLISAFWEELGWTGYATPRMLVKSTPLKVGLILGLIHAIWHLPASFWGSSVFHGELFLINFLVASVGIVILRIVTVWIYSKTKSVVLGWITHASFTTGQLLFVSLAFTSRETVIWQTMFMGSLTLVVLFILAKNWDLMKRKVLI